MSRVWSLSHRSPVPERRGITTVVAAIVLVVVLALVGVTSYALLGGFGGAGTKLTCQPPNQPACGQFQNLHDISLLLPFQSVQQNTTVPFAASLPSGESTSEYTFDFGDGTPPAKTASTITHHAYSVPGTYIVSVTAPVGGQTHDDYTNLVQITVTPSSTTTNAGTLPTVQGSILANTTVTAKTATAVLAPGQSVTVNATYTSAPTDPRFVPIVPTIQAPKAYQSSIVANGSTSVEQQITYNAPGVYTITFVGGASNGNFTSYANYTWTAFVATHAAVARSAVHSSPHPGTVIGYELVPGGAFSEDPAIDYETAGYESILNVYQTLIAYNGTSTGPGWENYIPELASCVPGSPQCARMYHGDNLVHGYNFTFVIAGKTSFYDPATGSSWGVYPSDVVFSIARTMAFSTLPCVSCNNGWILTQALLSHGNGTWSGIHGSYNNTPQNVYNAMEVNSTAYCPPEALQNDHGCVTFHVNGNNKPWPYFLELIADGLGGSIVPCGWFSSINQGAGIPYWTQANVTDAGDHPCALPGQGLGISPAVTPPLGWDHWEEAGSGYFGTYLGHVQFNLVGSGPYYMANYQIAAGYTLKSNPGYQANPYCTWSGCQPAAGQYASTIEITWETQATPGEQAYLSGIADFASIPSTDFSLLLQLIAQGKVHAETGPTLSIGFRPFDMNFNLQGAQRYATSPVSIPTDFFSYVGMRAFFAYSYPYQTVLNTFDTVHGVQLGFLSGGAIPQFMANYYPKDIPWPNQDPCNDRSSPACPGYWWDQMKKPGGPYFDREVLACSPSSQCEFPLFGTTGSPAGDAINALYATQILAFSNGSVKADPIDINFATLVGNSLFSGPGQNAMPFYGLGWAPDYPDPTDYVNPLYLANATYTNGNSVAQQLFTDSFADHSAGCAMGNSSATEQFYAENYVNTTCQGFAYKALLSVLNQSAFDTNPTERVALYALAEKIAFHLYLYVYTGQSNAIPHAAAWVDPASLNTNVTIGGGGDQTFYNLRGNDVQFKGST